VQRGGNGVYWWTVAVVTVNPYERSGAEAPARQLNYNGGEPAPSADGGDLALNLALAVGGVMLVCGVARRDGRRLRLKSQADTGGNLLKQVGAQV
jgi:hypothetical protein